MSPQPQRDKKIEEHLRRELEAAQRDYIQARVVYNAALKAFNRFILDRIVPKDEYEATAGMAPAETPRSD